MPSTSRLLIAVIALICWVTTAAAHAAPDPGPGSPSGPVATGPGSPSGAVLCGPPRLALGAAPTSASLAAAGETDCHGLAAAAGDRIRIRVVATSGSLVPRVEACAVAPAAEVTCVIGAAGTQTILVRDAAGTRTGDYTITVQRLNDPVGCSPLVFGPATATGALAAGETECRRFAGAAGDRVRLRVVTPAGTLDARAEVVRPDGTTRCAPTAADDLTCTLDADGVHTVLVRDAAAAGGGYSISVQRLGAPVGCLSPGFGPTATAAALQTSGETDCWRVTGAAGDRVRVRLVVTAGSADPRAEVLRPDGATDCSAVGGGELTCALELGGTQTILVRDAAPGTRTGSYRLAVQRLNDPVGCSWTPVGTTPGSGSIATTGETDCWRFSGAAQDRVRVRAIRTAGALNQTIEVLRPDGSTRCGAATGSYVCRLDDGGTHTILVRDWVGTASGDYGLAVQRLNDPVGCAPLAFGTGTSPGTIATAESDCWRFDGADGDRVRVRVVSPIGALDPVAEVLRPDGTTRCGPTGSDELDCVLDAHGTSTVLVRDQNGTSSGDYRVAVQRLNDPVGCDEWRTGWIAAGGTDCWRFGARAGDLVRFRVIRTDGDWDPIAEVVGPAGSTSCERTAVDDFVCELRSDGVHTLLLRDYFGLRYGGYGVDWQRLNTEPACQQDFSDLDSAGSILEAGEIDCFTLRQGFFGPHGPTLATRVRPTSGTLDPVVEVLRADGTTRCGPIPADEWRGCDVGHDPSTVTFLVYDAAGTNLGNYEVYASD